MSDSHDSVIRMYEGTLRAIDTKAQIFLAFLTITVSPVFGRLVELGAPSLIRITEGVLFGLATLMFVICLYPRRGRRSTSMLFDIKREGREIGAYVTSPDYAPDPSATLTVLHDIYRVKFRAVTFGILLLAAYVLTATAALSLI